jgi:hypothetical protein
MKEYGEEIMHWARVFLARASKEVGRPRKRIPSKERRHELRIAR